MNDSSRVLCPQGSARRRLLKGSFAVPTVITLHSGAALAASSAEISFQKLPKGVSTVNAPQPTSDTFWRVARYRAIVNGKNVRVFNGTSIKDLESLEGSARLLSSAFGRGKWYRVDNGQEVLGVTGVPSVDGKLLGVRVSKFASGPNRQFQISGVADTTGELGEARVMSRSCWTSLK